MRDFGLAVAAVAAFVSGASAQDGRFYVGISVNDGSLGKASESVAGCAESERYWRRQRPGSRGRADPVYGFMSANQARLLGFTRS